MEPNSWLREQVDERLEGLFSENSEMVVKTVADLLDQSQTDDEIEEILVETLEAGIEHGNDETMGLVWVCVTLGEMQSTEAIAPLQQALVIADEDLIGGAVRALRRIGEPALEAVLEQITDESVSAECYAACAAALEGVRLHPLPDLLDRIEHMFRRHVKSSSQRLSEATSDPSDPSRSLALRHLESAALTLARLGSAKSKPFIEDALELCDRSNSFLLEAIEIFEEQPNGIPCSAGADWQDEYRWALGNELPGGEFTDADEELREQPAPEFDPSASRSSDWE